MIRIPADFKACLAFFHRALSPTVLNMTSLFPNSTTGHLLSSGYKKAAEQDALPPIV